MAGVTAHVYSAPQNLGLELPVLRTGNAQLTLLPLVGPLALLPGAR